MRASILGGLGMHNHNGLQLCTQVSREHLHSPSKAQVTEFFLIKLCWKDLWIFFILVSETKPP